MTPPLTAETPTPFGLGWSLPGDPANEEQCQGSNAGCGSRASQLLPSTLFADASQPGSETHPHLFQGRCNVGETELDSLYVQD